MAVTTTYPDSSTKTFSYDANSNLTGWTDAQGTWARVYDADNRCTSESLGGTTRVSYTYDATGKKGLLSTLVDSGSRTITYSYTSRNQLYQVSESAGTTTYSYDNDGNETGITNPNSTTVTNVYDAENQLSSVTNKNSSNTTLAYLDAYRKDGGAPRRCILQSWYRFPEKVVSEDEAYTMTNLVKEAIRRIEGESGRPAAMGDKP
jgi:YD repeat-containing protein